jgi:hypothetical protein
MHAWVICIASGVVVYLVVAYWIGKRKPRKDLSWEEQHLERVRQHLHPPSFEDHPGSGFVVKIDQDDSDEQVFP